MKYYLRTLRLAMKRRLTLVGIIFTSLMVAFLWVANIGAIYPFVEVAFQSKSMHKWVDESIVASERNISSFREEIKTRENQLESAGEEDQYTLQADLHKTQGRLEAEEVVLRRLNWIEPYIKRYLPNDAFATLIAIAAFLFVGTLLRCAFLGANLMLVQRFSELTTFDLRNQFFQHMLRLELGIFGKERTGDLMSRMTGDIGSIGQSVAYFFGKAIREPLKMIACVILAAMISWRLLLVSLVICPLMFYCMYRLTGSIKRGNRRLMEEMAKLFGRLSQALGGIQEVKAYTMERHEQARFQRIALQVYRKIMRLTMYGSLTRLNNEVLGVGVICLAILSGGYLVVNQETHLLGIKMTDHPLKFSELILFYAYLIGVSDPARKLADLFVFLQTGAAASERVYPLLDQVPKIVDPPNPKSMGDVKGEIIFDNINFSYLEGQPVVKGVSLELKPGETVAIVGPNGCGKSTLARLLMRFYDPNEGSVRVDGLDVRELRQKDLRRQIGMVTQQTLLFDDTVFNNIRYGSSRATDAEVIAAAKKAHAHRFIMEKLEDGYDTNVGEQGRRLSGGQRQRISLARVILRNPSILILDEATSQIDPESERLIHQVLGDFVKDRTTIMITHRLSTLDLADRILVMDTGQIVDVGTHDELMARCEVYNRLRQTAFKESA